MTRLAYVMSTSFVVLAIAGRSSVSITPQLIWNASASAPIGLYTVRTAADLGVTDLVAVDAPEPLASFPQPARIPAAWRAADEAHRSASRTNCVPYRTQCQRRHYRDGRGAGARSARPRAAGLAGLSDASRERNLPHELGRPGQPRWPLLRTDPQKLHHRPRASAVDRRGR